MTIGAGLRWWRALCIRKLRVDIYLAHMRGDAVLAANLEHEAWKRSKELQK